MFFKNATFFTLPASVLKGLVAGHDASDSNDLDMAPPALIDALAECALKPVGPLEQSSYGFVAPFGGDGALIQSVDRHVMLTLAGEHKIIPPASVNSLLAKKCAEIEEKEGRRPGGRTRKRLKDEILQDLLPKALTKPSRTSAFLNTEKGYIVIDTPTRKTAENFISNLRLALGSLPALPLNAEVAPRAVMTAWLAGEELPEGLSLGDEAELRDPIDGGAVVKCRNQELVSDEIGKHLESGKQVTKLALCLADHMTFTIDEAMTLRKVRLLDGAVDSLESMESDDLHAELMGRFTLMACELEQAFEAMGPAFDLTKAEG